MVMSSPKVLILIFLHHTALKSYVWLSWEARNKVLLFISLYAVTPNANNWVIRAIWGQTQSSKGAARREHTVSAVYFYHMVFFTDVLAVFTAHRLLDGNPEGTSLQYGSNFRLGWANALWWLLVGGAGSFFCFGTIIIENRKTVRQKNESLF